MPRFTARFLLLAGRFKKMPLCFPLLIPFFSSLQSLAQKTDTASIFSQPITLDTFVIKSGFDVQAFVRRVQSDTTFYKAFRSMHLVSYNAINDIKVYGKNEKTIAS